MSLILPNRMPSKAWIQDAVHGHYTGHGWGKIAIVVDDEDRDNVLVVVGLPEQMNRQGAVAMSRFVISAEGMASKDEIERMVHKAAKKASHSLARQIETEKAQWH